MAVRWSSVSEGLWCGGPAVDGDGILELVGCYMDEGSSEHKEGFYGFPLFDFLGLMWLNVGRR